MNQLLGFHAFTLFHAGNGGACSRYASFTRTEHEIERCWAIQLQGVTNLIPEMSNLFEVPFFGVFSVVKISLYRHRERREDFPIFSHEVHEIEIRQ